MTNGKRMLATTLAASAFAAAALAPSASAAGDPVASGHFDFAISPAFSKQLRARHFSVRTKSLTIQSGNVDPTTGAATLKLGGSVRFKHRGQRITFGKLTATIGGNGSLRGSRLTRRGASTGSLTLFELNGGSVVREGFGARVSGVQATFGDATRKLSQKLGARLPGGTAGSLVVATQPATVEVLGGNATVTENPSLSSTLRSHCIDSVNGVTVNGDATEPGGPGTPFQIPVSGGTISPNGWTDGVVDLAGGMDIQVGGPGLPSGCPSSSAATVHLANFAVNVANKSILSDFSVGGPYSPWPGMVLRVELQGDVSNATMLADPANHSLTASGAQLGLDPTTVMIMNQYLPHASGTVTPFQVGDVLGSASMSVSTR
jgi:hypothetical protein